MKKQTKTEIISTRVTPKQREIIEEKAYSSYRTPSMYLRDCALGKKIIVVKGVDEVRNERGGGKALAVVKFVNAGSPMNNIFDYVTRREATESKLISGVNCSPESALEEFRFVKKRFHKEDGRSYYHIVQSFSPDDDLTPETAHEIGLKFAEYFPEFQVLVATHTNTHAVHNHLIMNSVNFENGKKFHQSRNEMLQAKEYSNQLCREYGLSVTETKTKNPRNARWKRDLIETASYAIGWSATKEEFIEYMREHGYKVQWEDKYKYITFTTPEGYKVRDNKLFDERFLKKQSGTVLRYGRL